MLFCPEKNGWSWLVMKKLDTHEVLELGPRSCLAWCFLFFFGAIKCSKSKFRILWEEISSSNLLFYKKPSASLGKAMESSSYAGSKRRFFVGPFFKGSFPGWWKVRHFAQMHAASFPEIETRTIFPSIWKSGWVLKQREKFKLRLISTKIRQTDWYYGHVFNCWTNSCWWTKF